MARVTPVDAERRPLGRRSVAREAESGQPVPRGEPGDSLECCLAHEVALVHPNGPLHAELRRSRVEVGVLTDENVALLQPEHPEGFQAVWNETEVRACLEEGVPESDGIVPRMVELEAELAGETEPEDVARDGSDAGASVTKVRERVVRQGVIGQSSEKLASFRTGDVDRAAGVRHVGDLDLVVPGLGPVAQPCLGLLGAAGRERRDTSVRQQAG